MFQLETKVVEHGTLRLVVSQASNAIGQTRFELIRTGAVANQAELDAASSKAFANPYRAYYRVNIYPALVACVVKATDNGQPIPWPPPFDDFFDDWPEDLADKLAAASRELNPHWWPKPEVPGEEDDSPKATPPEPTGPTGSTLA